MLPQHPRRVSGADGAISGCRQSEDTTFGGNGRFRCVGPSSELPVLNYHVYTDNLFTSLPLKEHHVKDIHGAVQPQEEHYKDVHFKKNTTKMCTSRRTLQRCALQEEHYKDVHFKKNTTKMCTSRRTLQRCALQEEHYKDVQQMSTLLPAREALCRFPPPLSWDPKNLLAL